MFRFALVDMGRMNGDPMGDLMCDSDRRPDEAVSTGSVVS